MAELEADPELLEQVMQEVYGTPELPTPGRIVWYQTDERNGLRYYLPAMVTVTKASHPGDYPDGTKNSLPVPTTRLHVHLTVYTPGGFGSTYVGRGGEVSEYQQDGENLGIPASFTPGAGSYVEWDVPYSSKGTPRTWRWPEKA